MEDRDEDMSCALCKSDYYLNRNLKLLVSPCYHRLCDACVQRLFTHGTAPCPVCETQLKRSNFVLPLFEDLQVEREVRVRKQVVAIFNQRLEDFASLKEYNDYLEEIEDMVFNLVHDVDVQKTNAKLESYRQQNQMSIARNARRMKQEESLVKQQQEMQVQRRMDYEQQLLDEMEREQMQLESEEAVFIEQLAGGTNRKKRAAPVYDIPDALKRRSFGVSEKATSVKKDVFLQYSLSEETVESLVDRPVVDHHPLLASLRTHRSRFDAGGLSIYLMAALAVKLCK